MSSAMIRLLINLLFLLIVVEKSISQLPGSTRPILKMPVGKKENFDYQFIMRDVHGRPFQNPYEEVTGSPFLLNDWKLASLVTKTKMVLDSVYVRINVYNNEMHYLTRKNEEMVAEKGLIRDIILSDSASGNLLFLKSGFPKIDNQNENNYYQVLSEGRLALLKCTRKIIATNKNDVSGESEKQFITYEDHFIFTKGEMKRLKKDKNFILKYMDDQKAAILSFVNTNSINFKNTNDLVKLFEYYNGL